MRTRYVLLLACLSCQRSAPVAAPTPPVVPTPPPASVTAAPGTAAPTAATGSTSLQPLPRAVGGVNLGMTVVTAEQTLGALACHDNAAGYRVCRPPAAPAGARNLELYINHDVVISLSYDAAADASPWDTLSGLIDRYGRPSLSGVRQQDKQGRMHEIYGWKDEQSLYSVRFVWRDPNSPHPELLTINIALWDRKGYDQWEAESRQHHPEGADSSAPGQPI